MEEFIPITCDRFVGLLDVMGFKDRIYKSFHDNVKDVLYSLHENLYDIINVPGKFNNAPSVLFPRIKVVMFSDTILLISMGSTLDDFIQISYLTGWVLKHCLLTHIPIKGAMSFGTFTADFEKSVYVGRPLVDDHLLQEELKYYGVIADCTVEDQMKNDMGLFQKYFIKYKTPFKKW